MKRWGLGIMAAVILIGIFAGGAFVQLYPNIPPPSLEQIDQEVQDQIKSSYGARFWCTDGTTITISSTTTGFSVALPNNRIVALTETASPYIGQRFVNASGNLEVFYAETVATVVEKSALIHDNCVFVR